MVEGKWLPPGADIAPALSLRREVLSLGRDAQDDFAFQALALCRGRAVGTGRIWWQEGDFYIGRLCVLPTARGQGYGDFLLRLLLLKAQQHHARRVLLLAPEGAAPFFQKYGFVPQGEPAGEGLLHTLCMAVFCRASPPCRGEGPAVP